MYALTLTKGGTSRRPLILFKQSRGSKRQAIQREETTQGIQAHKAHKAHEALPAELVEKRNISITEGVKTLSCTKST